MKILAIDPGNTDSGYALINLTDHRPLATGKVPNNQLLQIVAGAQFDHLAIEMIASYGMPVGREVFETCVWIGRFWQTNALYEPAAPARLVYRGDVKRHHCKSSKATDSNITRALVDRYTPGARNYGKGTKNAPGWFHGFVKDIWAAYAIATYVADQITNTTYSPADTAPTHGRGAAHTQKEAPF